MSFMLNGDTHDVAFLAMGMSAKISPTPTGFGCSAGK